MPTIIEFTVLPEPAQCGTLMTLSADVMFDSDAGGSVVFTFSPASACSFTPINPLVVAAAGMLASVSVSSAFTCAVGGVKRIDATATDASTGATAISTRFVTVICP